jgi:hypothetical protein
MRAGLAGTYSTHESEAEIHINKEKRKGKGKVSFRKEKN